MQSGFRFPKSTAVLMTIILAGIVLGARESKSNSSIVLRRKSAACADGSSAPHLLSDARTAAGDFLRRRTGRLGNSFRAATFGRSSTG